MINHVICFLWDIINHPFRNINGGFPKPALKLGHGWVITFQYIPQVPGRYTSRLSLIISVMSLWERWRLKSPASRLCVQPFVQAQSKENIKDPRHWFGEGNPPVTGGFSSQKASNAENVSIWLRHHAWIDFRHILAIKLSWNQQKLSTVGLHTEAEAKWLPFCRQNFNKCIFFD